MEMKKINKRTDVGFGKKVYLLGIDQDGQKVWLQAPKWDCGWYWGFGYIERYQQNWTPSKARDISSHTHWDSSIVGAQASDDLHSKILIHHLNDNPDFVKTTLTESESWELADLMKTFYTLQSVAGLYHTGNSHLTSNVGVDLKDEGAWKQINEVLLPKVFKRIDEILTPND